METPAAFGAASSNREDLPGNQAEGLRSKISSFTAIAPYPFPKPGNGVRSRC